MSILTFLKGLPAAGHSNGRNGSPFGGSRPVAPGVLAGYRVSDRQPVMVTEKERAVHTYVCGVSGSGKSRFLQALLFQDVVQGRPICVIDAMGDLYRSLQEFIASWLEHLAGCGYPIQELAAKYLFLDANDPENPVRLNPLDAQDDESSEQQVDDLMRAIERLLGSMEEQRKLRNILRGVFLMTAELNRLPPEKRPPEHLTRQHEYPLNLFFAVDILNMTDEERYLLMAAIPDTVRLRFRRQYWEFFALGSPRDKHQIVQSSWNIAQFLLDDTIVLRVLDTHRSTFHIPRLLREGVSLICHLPLGGNLGGTPFLGKLLTTKLQQAAYRRPEEEWNRRYYLYLDEFHHFVDQALADAFTNLRKFGLSVLTAHQSLVQPPFESMEGQALLQTIKGNSRVKAIFRLDRPDAEVIAQELFQPTQQRRNFQVEEHAWSESEQRGSTTTRSTTRTTGSQQSWSQSHSSSSSEQEISRNDARVTRGSQQGDGRSEQSQQSTGEQNSDSLVLGRTKTTTSRQFYYTLEGERELHVNELRRLRDRQFYLASGVEVPQLLETPFVPDQLYCYQAANLPALLLNWQRRRLHAETAEHASRTIPKPEGADGRILRFERPHEPDTRRDAEPQRESPSKRIANHPFVD